jgi:isopentenyl-diphosphate delta-isomerase
MNAVGEDMLIDAVDASDSPVETIKRGDVFVRQANFRVSHVFLFNRYNKLLIQQIAFLRDRHPGQWGSSIAGYLFAGESYEAAAQRRLREELGVLQDGLRLYGKTVMMDKGCKKFISLFLGSAEGPFRYDRSHVQGVEFMSIPEIVLAHRNGERIFTGTFLHVLEFYRQEAT